MSGLYVIGVVVLATVVVGAWTIHRQERHLRRTIAALDPATRAEAEQALAAGDVDRASRLGDVDATLRAAAMRWSA